MNYVFCVFSAVTQNYGIPVLKDANISYSTFMHSPKKKKKKRKKKKKKIAEYHVAAEIQGHCKHTSLSEVCLFNDRCLFDDRSTVNSRYKNIVCHGENCSYN